MIRYIVLAVAILLFLGMYFFRTPSQPQNVENETLSVVDSGSEESGSQKATTAWIDDERILNA